MITGEIAHHTSIAIANAGVTRTDLAARTGIAYSTLNRKLDGRSDFSVQELVSVAEAIGAEPLNFVQSLLKDALSAPHPRLDAERRAATTEAA